MTTLNPETAPNPIPAPIQTLLSLFESELADVKFPDVDREVLLEASDRVRVLAEDVARAEAALEAARAAFQEGQDALIARGQRALAYARVFAEGTPELSARLEAIVFGRTPRRASKTDAPAAVAATPSSSDEEPAAPKRRGRPPKAKPREMEEDAAAELLPTPSAAQAEVASEHLS